MPDLLYRAMDADLVPDSVTRQKQVACCALHEHAASHELIRLVKCNLQGEIRCLFPGLSTRTAHLDFPRNRGSGLGDDRDQRGDIYRRVGDLSQRAIPTVISPRGAAATPW